MWVACTIATSERRNLRSPLNRRSPAGAAFHRAIATSSGCSSAAKVHLRPISTWVRHTEFPQPDPGLRYRCCGCGSRYGQGKNHPESVARKPWLEIPEAINTPADLGSYRLYTGRHGNCGRVCGAASRSERGRRRIAAAYQSRLGGVAWDLQRDSTGGSRLGYGPALETPNAQDLDK